MSKIWVIQPKRGLKMHRCIVHFFNKSDDSETYCNRFVTHAAVRPLTVTDSWRRVTCGTCKRLKISNDPAHRKMMSLKHERYVRNYYARTHYGDSNIGGAIMDLRRLTRRLNADLKRREENE